MDFLTTTTVGVLAGSVGGLITGYIKHYFQRKEGRLKDIKLKISELYSPLYLNIYLMLAYSQGAMETIVAACNSKDKENNNEFDHVEAKNIIKQFNSKADENIDVILKIFNEKYYLIDDQDVDWMNRIIKETVVDQVIVNQDSGSSRTLLHIKDELQKNHQNIHVVLKKLEDKIKYLRASL